MKSVGVIGHMLDLEEYKKTAVITDRNGVPADPKDCVYEHGERIESGEKFEWYTCKTHGHGFGERKLLLGANSWGKFDA